MRKRKGKAKERDKEIGRKEMSREGGDEDLREEKAYTTTTERKSFGELFWPQRKTFQAGGGYKNPIKTRKTISTTEIFPLWPPFFSGKESSALEQGGVCFLFPGSVPPIPDDPLEIRFKFRMQRFCKQLGVDKMVVFERGGFGGCSPGKKTGTRVHSDVPPERKPERGHVRMFPRNENRNEGTFAKTTLVRNRPLISQ